MLISCPHCKTDLDAKPEHYGQHVQCPACHGRLQIPRPDEAAGTGNPQRPQRDGWEEKDHANVDFIKSLMIGIGLTAGFLGLLVPIRDSNFGALFLGRGWVNYAETFLFLWGMTILVMKSRKNSHQARAALLQLFPDRLGREINQSTVGGFIDNIYRTPLSLRDSIIVNRIRKALELFELRLDNGEVAAFLSTQSDLDANRSSGSYAMLKVFLWAIPILGFIGTVQGLSTAVSSLAMGDTSNPEALKASIDSLTGGLGVAFDTTLLGLILSMLMSFPMSAVQKKEDETLTLIDTFCTEKLLPRLNDKRDGTSDILLQQADSIPGLVSSLARAHETFLVNLNDSTKALRQTGEVLESRLAAHQHAVEQTFVSAVQKLAETSAGIHTRAHDELNTTFERIACGIDLLNKALKDLGEKGIPPEAKKKRGFFSR